MLINSNRNEGLIKVITGINETFETTLDTENYVPEKALKLIYKTIIKSLKRDFKRVEKEDRLYQRAFKKHLKFVRKNLNYSEVEKFIKEYADVRCPELLIDFGKLKIKPQIEPEIEPTTGEVIVNN